MDELDQLEAIEDWAIDTHDGTLSDLDLILHLSCGLGCAVKVEFALQGPVVKIQTVLPNC